MAHVELFHVSGNPQRVRVAVDGVNQEPLLNTNTNNVTLTDTSSLLDIGAINSADSSPAVDEVRSNQNFGRGIRDGDDNTAALRRHIDGDEKLFVKLENDNFEGANRVTVDVADVSSSNGAQVRLELLNDGVLVKTQVFNLGGASSGSLVVQSPLAQGGLFDEVRVSAADADTLFAVKSVEFDTVDITTLRVATTATGLQVFQDSALVESGAVGSTFNRVGVSAIASPRGPNNVVDQVTLGASGLGIQDGDDGRRFRTTIEGDEKLVVAVDPGNRFVFDDAFQAQIQLGSVTSSDGATIRVEAVNNGAVVGGQTFTLPASATTGTLAFQPGVDFDQVRISAGDFDTAFTVAAVEFKVYDTDVLLV